MSTPAKYQHAHTLQHITLYKLSHDRIATPHILLFKSTFKIINYRVKIRNIYLRYNMVVTLSDLLYQKKTKKAKTEELSAGK